MPRVDVPEYKTFVDFPDGTPPEEMQTALATQFPQRDSLLTRAKKGVTNFAVSTARAATPLAFAVAPLLSDKTKQDLSNFYDETGGFLAQNQPTKPNGVADRVVDAVSGLAPAIATGPVGAAAILNNAITGKAAESRDAGDTALQTIGKAASSGAAMAGNLAIPIGGVVKTLAGAGGAVALSNADRVVQNALSDEKSQTPFDLTTNVLEPIIMQLGFGGVAHFQQARGASKVIDNVATRMERGENVSQSEINNALAASKVFLRREKRNAAQGRIAAADAGLDARFGAEPVAPGVGQPVADSEFSPDFGRPAPPVLDAEATRPNAQTSVRPTGAHPDVMSIEVARLKQEHPYWSDAEYLKEAVKTVQTHNPEVLPAATDMSTVRPATPAPERPAEQAPSRTVEAQSMENFSHDSVPEAAVTAVDSMVLQAAAPHLKVAVVGTPAEVAQLDLTGKTVMQHDGKAYVIDPAAAKEKYGSVLEAKRAIKAGGDSESEALGYPSRPAGEPLQTAAVTKTGEVLTDPAEIRAAATAGEVAYAAEGAPAELQSKTAAVADALKPATEKRGSISDEMRQHVKNAKRQFMIDTANEVKTKGVARVDDTNLFRIVAKSTTDDGYRITTFSKGPNFKDQPLGHSEHATLKEAMESLTDDVGQSRFRRPDLTDDAYLDVNPKNTEYVYEYKYRPMSIGTQPEGFLRGEEGGKHGRVIYDHPLRQAEMDSFELKPIEYREVQPDLAPAKPTELHAGIHLPTLVKQGKDLWTHYTAKLDPTAPAGSVKEFLDANRRANASFGQEPLVNKLKRALIDSSANVQEALMRQGSAGEFVRRQFDAISGASAKAQVAVEKQREALSGMSLREQQAMGDLVAIDRDLAIAGYRYKVPTSDPSELYKYIGDKTPSELAAARATFQQDYKLTDAEMSRVDNATKQYFAAWKENTQRMLDAGLIDATQKAALDAQDYSPKQFLEKIDPDSQAFSSLGGGRVTVPDSGIKRLKEGSDSYFRSNPMRLLSEATARIETRIARNEANQALATLPAGNGIAEVVKPGAVAPAGYEAVSYMENGKQQTIHMPVEYAKEWRQNDPLINSELVNWLQWLTGAKVVRAAATGYNPAFLISNVPRDLMAIWLQAEKKGYSPHAPLAVGQIAKDLGTVARDAWGRSGRYLDYVKQGGGRELLTHEGALSSRRENLAPAVAKVQKVLAYVNEFSEVVTRLAYRERMIKNGMDPAMASKAAAEYVDFSRGGAVIKAVDRLGIPYLNAAVQGTRGMARAAGRDPAKFAYKTAQIMMGAAGIYALNQLNNPEGWANVSDREKADNFIIMLPKAFEYLDKDGTTVSPYMKISKEQSMRPFSTAAELLTHWANGGKPTKQQMEMAVGAALPVAIDKMPPAAAAFWTYALNADTYKKEPVWKGKQEIEPYAEYTNNTDPIYRDIGAATATPDAQGVMRGGISPERLKAAVGKIVPPSNAYLQAAGNGLDALYEKMNPSDRAQFSKTNYEKLRSVPGISRLLGGAKDTEQFREGIREARTATATQQFEVNKTLDAMVLRYVKTGKTDPELYDRIVAHVDKQSGEARGRLENRISDLVETADLPDRGWWMSVKALQPEDRADQFKARLAKVSPDEQARMIEIANGLSGFSSERFLERYNAAP